MSYSIYLAQNNCDGRVYIGQTVQRPEKRWAAHKSDSRRKATKSPFHQALREFGEELFSFSVIEEVETREQADNAETVWISLFDSTNPDRKIAVCLPNGERKLVKPINGHGNGGGRKDAQRILKPRASGCGGRTTNPKL